MQIDQQQEQLEAVQGSLLKERAEMIEGTESFKLRREEAEATRSKQEEEMSRLTQVCRRAPIHWC